MKIKVPYTLLLGMNIGTNFLSSILAEDINSLKYVYAF